MDNHIEDTLVTIATFEYAQFAYLAKAKLESEGIDSCINDEYLVSMNWLYANAVGGIKLKVLSGDVDKALKILNENGLTENSEELRNAGIDEDEEIIKCPYCHSTDVIDEKYSKKWAYLAILFLGFPLVFKRSKYLCQSCKYTWKKEKK